jgi:hypothetical protein
MFLGRIEKLVKSIAIFYSLCRLVWLIEIKSY